MNVKGFSDCLYSTFAFRIVTTNFKYLKSKALKLNFKEFKLSTNIRLA